MQFTHVHIRNWRNFRDLRFNVGPRLFIVGPNASGKSNLLDVFRFLALHSWVWGEASRPAVMRSMRSL